ncbi:MAG: hypothetical protein Q9160_002100 [Pyrenula sp. 1 TL-2023]
MAASETKTSFLGSISPWANSRASTPHPSDAEIPKKEEPLQKSDGLDHSISYRPPPSLRKYPRDCPSLKTRWFYAVDVPKRKPLGTDKLPQDNEKTKAVPKKLVPFSALDSQAIETAFQSLADKQDRLSDQGESQEDGVDVKVPVNEDYLFDVNIKKRELEPAYWLGPVYEVRRGSWFYVDGSSLKPCDENLANQLEEGYLKLSPWKISSLLTARSSSQPRSRPTSMTLAPSAANVTGKSDSSSTKQAATETKDGKVDASNLPTYRLFGAYMNSKVTYQDASIAWLSSDDLMSWMSSAVYQRFGTVGGTKLVRGYTESGKQEAKPVEIGQSNSLKRRSAPPGTYSSTSSQDEPMRTPPEKQPHEVDDPKKHDLERKISSLAGDPGEPDIYAEEARKQEEQEMEDSRRTEGQEQDREIDHLVLVTHGIGQKLGIRYDSLNFIHDVNTFRKTLKAVYNSAPDLQALNAETDGSPKNCRVQVLPVCWRHLLDFPRQSFRQARNESDLADAGADDEAYPSLADIAMGENSGVRNLITDLALDVLLYQSAYREPIANIVQQECNRLVKLFKQRNPKFSGRVSLCGHSLGSAIMFDILCRQKEPQGDVGLIRKPAKSNLLGTQPKEQENDLALEFDCESFFCFGSPIALFQMLKGRTVAARNMEDAAPAHSPFDPVPANDPFDTQSSRPRRSSHILPISVSSPRCLELYNIFHPADPIAHRIEPLISPAMTDLKPQPLPLTKKGLFDAPGLSHIGTRVGQSVGSMWYNLRSGVASSLLNRSLGLSSEDYAGAAASKTNVNNLPNTHDPAQIAQSVANTQLSDGKKQQELAAQTLKRASSSSDSDPAAAPKPTLIDTELETLYAGFQRSRSESSTATATDPSSQTATPAAAAASSSSTSPPFDESPEEYEARARRYRREEAKVRALNSNGRVDYSIQESMVNTFNPLSSIASHLVYWADEDVNHFLISQLLARERAGGRREGARERERGKGGSE